MSKTIKCKSCGAEIAKSAKICPHCGVKNKKHTALIVCVSILAILIIVGNFGNSENDPQQVGTVDQGETAMSNQQEADSPSIYHVGDIVQLDNINVTLLGVYESNGSQFIEPTEGNVYVTFEFDIDNQSDSEITVSSMMSFEAYFDDYSSNISIGAMGESDKAQLDGSVAAGKK